MEPLASHSKQQPKSSIEEDCGVPKVSITKDNLSMIEDNKFVLNQLRMSVEQRLQQAEHFLSFKNQRAFKTVEKFTDHYRITREIGSGAFGSVKLGQHKKSQVPCAIKVIRKTSLAVANVYKELNKNELQVLEETQHPHITRVFELMEDSRNYYIIMELVSGGNLFEKIKSLRHFSED